jgi:hypothetical protein
MYLELSTTGDAVDTEVQPKRFDLGVLRVLRGGAFCLSLSTDRLFRVRCRIRFEIAKHELQAGEEHARRCTSARPSNSFERYRITSPPKGHGGQEGQTYSKTRFFLRVPGVLRGGELDSAMRSLEAAGNRIVGCGRPLYSAFNGKGSLLYRLSSLYQVRTKAWWPPAGGLLAFDAAQATLGAVEGCKREREAA